MIIPPAASHQGRRATPTCRDSDERRSAPTPAAADPSCAALLFTGILDLSTEGAGTRYKATVVHGDPDSCARHAAMEFSTGWRAALDQLVALCKG